MLAAWRRAVSLAVALIVWPAALHAAEGTCWHPSVACGSETFERLEDSSCRFLSSGTRYVGHQIEVVAGTVITVTATSGAFAPELRFYRHGGTPILRVLNQTASTITGSLQVPTSDMYLIAISSGDGKESGPFFLNVSCDVVCVKPFVVGLPVPRGTTVNFGTRVQLSAPIDGTPLLRYRWFDVAKPSVTLSTEERYVTEPLTANAAFGVTVSNACGEVTATVLVVNVNACTPASIARNPAEQRVRAGESAKFWAEVSGTPPFTFEWFEGEKGDTSRPVTTGAVSSTLDVARATHNTSYWVRVTNSCGSADSLAAKLIVEPRRRAARH